MEKHDRMSEIYIVVKEPGKPPIGRMIMDTPEALQRIVGGYLERIVCDAPEGLTLFANEDAKRRELKKNLFLGGSLFNLILGTCLLRVAFDEQAMTPDQMVAAGKWLKAIAV